MIISTTEKRGPGKVKGCLAIRDMYKYYLSITPKDYIKYKQFALIIKESNKELIDQIVNESEAVTLPYRLGVLRIVKSERKFNPEYKKNWKVNYQESKKQGFIVYYDQESIYRWAWIKARAIVRNKTGYKFVANRLSKRMVAAALRNKRDFYK
tara:strand:+ start:101 stop:559 length:459 start_codon:yes stop_codon:yes gene_type:complete